MLLSCHLVFCSHFFSLSYPHAISLFVAGCTILFFKSFDDFLLLRCVCALLRFTVLDHHHDIAIPFPSFIIITHNTFLHGHYLWSTSRNRRPCCVILLLITGTCFPFSALLYSFSFFVSFRFVVFYWCLFLLLFSTCSLHHPRFLLSYIVTSFAISLPFCFPPVSITVRFLPVMNSRPPFIHRRCCSFLCCFYNFASRVAVVGVSTVVALSS